MLKVNDYVVQPTIFPDGTSQVWKLPESVLSDREPNVTWLFDNEAELIWLAQLRDILPAGATLWMPYLPYGRQDKGYSNDATFALSTFSRLLNRMCFDDVSSFDAHSDIAWKLIDNFSSMDASSLIETLSSGFDYICYPDAGAWTRYDVYSKPAIIARKVRDQSNGRIVLYELDEGTKPEPGSNVLVVDDICDGGATFVKLGEVLQAYKIRASLYVSHGIFSKGLEPLKPYYERIFTTDSRPVKYKELVVYESAPSHRLLQG